LTRSWYMRLLALLLVAGLTIGMAACGDDDPDDTPAATEEEETEAPEDTETEEAADGAGDVIVTAVDYGFDIPTELPAGPISISLVNEGEEKHFLSFVKLTDDAPDVPTLLDMKEKESEKFLEEDLGFIPTVKPGQEGKKTIEAELTPGRYVSICFVPNKEGTPHAFLGMYVESIVS
jgi:hypothetical protein